MTPQLQLERDTSKYLVDGVRVPSVTEIMEIAGLVDLPPISPEDLEVARRRGKLVHAATVAWDTHLATQDELPEQYAEVSGYVEAYAKFRAETHWIPMYREHAFVCRGYRFAGTVDGVFQCPKTSAIIIGDLKSGPLVADYVSLQLSGYEIGMNATDLRGHFNVQRWAIRLMRDGRYRLQQYRDRQDLHDFLGAARVAHRRIRMGGVQLAA